MSSSFNKYLRPHRLTRYTNKGGNILYTWAHIKICLNVIVMYT